MRAAARGLGAALLLTGAAASAATVEVPVDVGVGPAGFWFVGPLLDARGAVPHFALRLNAEAVIDDVWVSQHRNSIPKKYRSMADGVREVRIGASIFIPSTLYISPGGGALGPAGVYGATWAPLGLTLFRAGGREKPVRFSADASLLLTYLFIHGDGQVIPTTHFIRPGLELQATTVVAATERFLISLGGGAQAWVPQALGAFGWEPFDRAMWLAAFAFLKFHVRFEKAVAL